MGDLYTALRKRVPANARRVVDICADELPEYRAAAADSAGYAQMLDFAVFIRRRTLELVTGDQPLTADDLSVVTAIGEERGRNGMSEAAARRILALHAAATLREIHEASGAQDLNDAMRLLAWLGPQGTVSQQAYTLGFLRGRSHRLSSTGQVRRFAELALAGDPAAPGYAAEIGISTPAQYQVIVTRTPGPAEPTGILDVVWRRYRAPATWHQPDELVALLPVDEESAALALVRDVAEVTGGPCAVGTAAGPLSTLAETFALARRVSQVCRGQTVPDHLYTVADVFIEIGVAELPEIDRWLRDVARQLAAGSALLPTLDAYYRHDLDRTRTAASLNIHPRTLDYRLRRARELTGIDPHTTSGIRVFTTAITRQG